MTLQNRVDPFGSVHAVAARGLFTGNRGVIHDPETKTLLKRRWTTKAWIVCDCGFKGRRREVFGRNGRTGGPGWTNLFFLDEVTALAAGHRPCFECRRESDKTFARCLAAATGAARLSAPEIDAMLHPQRRAAGAAPVLLSPGDDLPDGAMFAVNGIAYAQRGSAALCWSFEGYMPVEPPHGRRELLTPPATVAALRAGYRPVWATPRLPG
ncbi:MAG: hypothetical protein J0H34_19785 [Rhizobiales bacterium]|nr:hypothetical protein [Hyphomicrobiales bacterium]